MLHGGISCVRAVPRLIILSSKLPWRCVTVLTVVTLTTEVKPIAVEDQNQPWWAMPQQGANAALCGYSYADSGVSARSKSSRKKNNNKKLKHGTGVTSRAAKPRSCADNNPAAPLTAILALMTGFVSPWHRCASAAAPSKWRISVRTHWLVENKRSPFTGKLHWGTCLRLHTDILISSYASAGVITMVGWLALNALMLQVCMLAMFT